MNDSSYYYTTDYYKRCDFIFDNQLWIYDKWYNAFIWMLFSHDPVITIAWQGLTEFVLEFSIVLAVWFDLEILRMKKSSDPGLIVIDFLVVIFAIVSAIVVIKLIKSPRLLVYPYEDVLLINQYYNVKIQKEKSIFKFSRESYRNLRIKYWVELLFIQYLPSRFLWLIPQTQGYKSYIIHYFRIDWALYFLCHFMIIVVLIRINYWDKIERDVLWKGKERTYALFYGLWIITWIIMMLPFSYNYFFPIQALLISNSFVLLLFLFALLFKCILTYLKNKKYRK